MKMRLLVFNAILFCGLCFVSQSDAQTATTTVRGQLLRGGQFPAPGIQVTLYHSQYGRSSPSTTGGDGMYYIYNVPPGAYILEVWISKPPVAYPVQVGTFPYSDLARVAVP